MLTGKADFMLVLSMFKHSTGNVCFPKIWLLCMFILFNLTTVSLKSIPLKMYMINTVNYKSCI